MAKKTKKRKVIIFDLDGTLYALRGGSYAKSPLRKCVLQNTEKFIAVRLSTSASNARSILRGIQKKYGEQISIGLEKEFSINRYDYFNTVWDIPANGIVKKSPRLTEMLNALRKQYRFALVSDAPRVWIRNVLKELEIQSFFSGRIFSGEGNRRKGLGTAFREVARILKTNTRNCIVVGDQERTDMVPAKKLGMHTIFIHRTRHSPVADFRIRHIRELSSVIAKLSKKETLK